MPWHIAKDQNRCSSGKPWAVIKDSDDSVEGCHTSEQEAKDHMAALYANEDKSDHPRDYLVRMLGGDNGIPRVEIRDQGEGKQPELYGHFAVFNRWTKIDSIFEGTFMERISPGAFKKTFEENRKALRVLFQHGYDPQIGDKPLGVINDLREDDQGAFYSVDMFDTSYNRDLIPALKAGQYGASFRMRVLREEYEQDPEPSEGNPNGLDQRTIKEIRLYEFGPVTFPAYEDASAGVRSITDEMILSHYRANPDRFNQLLRAVDLELPVIKQGGETEPVIAPPKDAGRKSTSDGRRSSNELVIKKKDGGTKPLSSRIVKDDQDL